MLRLNLLRDLHKSVLQSLTDEDEADSYDVSQQVGSERLLVSAVTFAEEADERVEMVLTETLAGTGEKSSSCADIQTHSQQTEVIAYLEDLGSRNQAGQSRGQGCSEYTGGDQRGEG